MDHVAVAPATAFDQCGAQRFEHRPLGVIAAETTVEHDDQGRRRRRGNPTFRTVHAAFLPPLFSGAFPAPSCLQFDGKTGGLAA
jgi:hypothetical protein